MIGEAAALGSAALWASSTVAIKDVTGRRSAVYIMAVRTGIAAVLGLAFVLIARPAALTPNIPSSTFAVLLGSGLIAILGDAIFIRAIAVDDVSRVFTISTSLYILMSVCASILFIGGQTSWFLPLGGLAVLIGSKLVMDPSSAGQRAGAANGPSLRRPVLALWLSVAASVVWTASLLIVSHAMKSVDPLSATVLRLPFMAAAMAVVVVVRGEYRHGSWPGKDFSSLFLSGVMVLGSIVLFLTSAKASGAGTVAVLTSTSPIFAVPFAYFFLKERVTLRVAGGTAACMVGICLAVL